MIWPMPIFTPQADFGRLGSVTRPGFDFGRPAYDEAHVQIDQARDDFHTRRSARPGPR
jgi:hypothetical protein